MVAQMADTAWLSPNGNDINLFAFAKAAHQNAVAHGWYDDGKGGIKEREVSEILLNLGGEIREFKAQVWADKLDTYYAEKDGAVCPKPEGAWIELADLLIRFADSCGYYFTNASESARFRIVDYSFVEAATHGYIGQLAERISGSGTINYQNRRHKYLTADWLDEQVGILWEMYRRTSHENFIAGLWEVYVCIFELLNREYPGKIVPAIVLKYEYNKGRPYRHGGLRA